MGQRCHPAAERLNAELTTGQQRRTEGRLPLRETEQISGDAHLAITAVAGADADHRDGQLGAEAGSQLRRHVLQHQREAAGRLQIQGGAAQTLLADRIVGLTAIAKAMHRLGSEPQMGHHRDAAAHQAIHHGDGFRFTTLQFDGSSRAVLEHTAGSGHGIINAALVAEKRQIGHDQRLLTRGPPQAAADGARVQDHLLQCHRQGGGMAEHHHRQGIAHQDHIGAGLLHQSRREGIPGGEHGDRPALLLVAEQIRWSQGLITTKGWAHC